MSPSPVKLEWIRALARPYLRSYRAQAERRGSLRGYWFFDEAKKPAGARKQSARRGFFVGYLLTAEGYEFLKPAPPECMVFAFVHPVGGAQHRRLVAKAASPVRKTWEYIRWLTHHLPRFVYHSDAPAAMARHHSMAEWPREKWEHFSRNFFIETLALLVRSGLVKRLATSSNQ